MGFVSITRTDEELSLVVPEEWADGREAQGLRVEPGWRALKVAGPLEFSIVGVLASLATLLAEASISIFVVSTFDTDYLLVPADRLSTAIEVLKQRGHVIGD